MNIITVVWDNLAWRSAFIAWAIAQFLKVYIHQAERVQLEALLRHGRNAFLSFGVCLGTHYSRWYS